MRCSNCGKNTRSIGRACQWCGSDISNDQIRIIYSKFSGLIGGVLGYFAAGVLGGIVGLVLGSMLSIIVAKKIDKPAAKISAAPLVLLSLGLVLFIWWMIPSARKNPGTSPKHTSSSSQDSQNSSGTETGAASSSKQPAYPPASSSGVQGLSANWLLAKQSNKHEETMKSLAGARESGDVEAFKRILMVRSAELAQAIEEVKTGSYSIQDKEKMLVPLQQEKDWADASIITISK